MSADRKPFIRYDLDDPDEYSAYLQRLEGYKRALQERIFPDWGPKEPSITLLDPLHHVPLSSHGMVSPNAGDRVYDPSQDVPISGVTRVIALGGPDLPVHFRSLSLIHI